MPASRNIGRWHSSRQNQQHKGISNMAELDSAAIRKRQAWSEKSDTEDYVEKMGRYALVRDERIVASMLGHGPGKLLDLPCGTGRYLDLEKERGFEIVAADYSPTMLSVAKRHQDVKFVQADAFDPPFDSESFDVILVSRLLFHYRNPEAIIGALSRCLKPGGKMVFDTLNRFSLRWWASMLLRPLHRDPARRLYFETHRSMTRKLDALGLKVKRRTSAYVLPTRSYRLIGRVASRVIHCFETFLPAQLRVLTFWQVERGS